MRQINLAVLMMALAVTVWPQSGTTTFTGTVITYGSGYSTRTATRTFNLRIKGVTPESDARRFVKVLEDDGQDALLNAIRSEDLGTFSIGGGLGRRVNAVRIENVDGKKRVRAVLERWLGFGEMRAGYRSVDYPFSYIELLIDPRTGKGEGTYFAAAKIRFKRSKGAEQIEVEDFGVFPGRMLRVEMRGQPLP